MAKCVPVSHVVEQVCDVSVPQVDEQEISTQDQHLQQIVAQEIDESLLKMQRPLRVGDIVYVRQGKLPKVVFRIGHGYLEGKVRVARLTKDTSIWETGEWEWCGHCSLVGD